MSSTIYWNKSSRIYVHVNTCKRDILVSNVPHTRMSIHTGIFEHTHHIITHHRPHTHRHTTSSRMSLHTIQMMNKYLQIFILYNNTGIINYFHLPGTTIQTLPQHSQMASAQRSKSSGLASMPRHGLWHLGKGDT